MRDVKKTARKTFHSRVIFRHKSSITLHIRYPIGFLILTSSHYRLLSTSPGDVLNKIALLNSNSEAKAISALCSANIFATLSETVKEVWRRKWRFKSYCKIRVQSRIFIMYLPWEIIQDHPTAVTCLPPAAERFKSKSCSIFFSCKTLNTRENIWDVYCLETKQMRDETASHDLIRNNELALSFTGNLQFSLCFSLNKLSFTTNQH